MQEFEPKKKYKIFTKEFYIKYSYVFILALILILGVSYSYTFFIQNKKITSGSITTAGLTVNFSDRNINATNITVPTTDGEGLSTIVKSLTITNATNTDGRVKLTLERTSGFNLTDMKYALVVNGAIQEIDNVPSDGVILETAILGNEIINVELRLWPKTDYSGSETTFVGTMTPEIKYYGLKASDRTDLANAYVNFNCLNNVCEVWRIVKVESGRLVLTREADLSGATERVNSGVYDPTLTFNDDSMITSVSTDGKNVYLAKTVKIESGDGTSANPYNLINPLEREPDKKVIATITYKNGTDTVGTQYIYYGQTNYISQVVDNPAFEGWTDNTNDYDLGDTVNFTSDTILTAKIVERLQSKIMTLCNDNNIAYVQKYNATNNGAAIDTPDGSGSEDVCYYTTISVDRNSDAEKNSNVIFGDYCWQIVRTTTDGGVKLVYNGLKTQDNKCTSDADTENYSSNPRPSVDGVTGTYHQSTDLSGNKKYGTGFELYDDNGTTKFKLTGVSLGNWASNYTALIGKYTCMSDTDEICTTLYYVGHKQSSTNASTVSYTISTPAHYSQIGTSSYNAFYDSPALVGYMYNDVYRVIHKNNSTVTSAVIDRQSLNTSTEYYYGDKATWNPSTNKYELTIDDNGTDITPPTTTTWSDIRSTVGGKYTCKSNNSTTGTSCAIVYYVVANSSDSYMYSVPLSNNENKDKQVTWTYGTGVTKSGNTYTLTGTNTITFKLADWYTDYANYNNIYICDDYTSTNCSVARFISGTSNHYILYKRLDYTYYFASDISYDSTTNTYSYDANGTIIEVYDWYHQYNTLNNNHYMCENYDSANNTCGTNNPIYYIVRTSDSVMYYTILDGVPNIETALVNMLSNDTGTTVNKYNSAIKGIIDNWYKQNIENNNLSSYLDDDAVFCNDRTIISLGGWSKTGSLPSDNDIIFKYSNVPSKANATFTCANITDRFSKTNEKATLTYPVGLLSESERATMYVGFVTTGQYWWLGSPTIFNSPNANGRNVSTVGGPRSTSVHNSYGVRPSIVLKPGIELESGGEGTYNNPYVVKTS